MGAGCTAPAHAYSCHPRVIVPAAEQSIGMQEEGERAPPPPISSALNPSEGPDGQPMFRLMCGEPGCTTAIWLRPDQLGLEPVNMEAMDLHQVGTASAFLLSPSMNSLVKTWMAVPFRYLAETVL